MRRISLLVLAAVAVFVVAVTSAVAISPHFKGTPTVTDQGTTLNVQGTVAGLGSGPGTFTLEATGFATVTCTNPSGKNEPPGQQPEPITLTSVPTNFQPSRAGNASFNLTTLAPTGEGACKPNFTPTVTDVQFTSATLVIDQGGTITRLPIF